MADALEVRVAAAEVDLASGLLWGAGVTAVAEHPAAAGTTVLRVDVPPGGLGAVATALDGRWAVEAVEVDDGLDGWRAHARVVRAGRFVVHPPWVPLGPVGEGEVVVEVDPGRAFGHGAHPTTRLCLEVLSDELSRRDAPSVLDVGCGSGVLAVAAALCRAVAVAVDIDPEAVRATEETAARNRVADRVAVGTGPVSGSADVVLANIGAGTLRELAPALLRAVAPGGVLVLSGLLDPPPPDLVGAFAPLALADDRRLDGWSALVFAEAG